MPAPTIASRNDGQTALAASLAITLTNAPSVGGIVVVLASAYSGTGSGAWDCTTSGGSGISITERVNTLGTANDTSGCLIYTVEYSSAPTSITISRVAAGVTAYISATCLNITGQTGSYFDVAGSGSGSSTTPSATGMGDTTDANDIVLGVMTRNGTSGTVSAAGSWTEIVEIDETNSTYQTMNAIQQSPGAAGAYDPEWSLNPSDGWVAAGIAIKGTAGGGGGGIFYIRA